MSVQYRTRTLCGGPVHASRQEWVVIELIICCLFTSTTVPAAATAFRSGSKGTTSIGDQLRVLRDQHRLRALPAELDRRDCAKCETDC